MTLMNTTEMNYISLAILIIVAIYPLGGVYDAIKSWEQEKMPCNETWIFSLSSALGIFVMSYMWFLSIDSGIIIMTWIDNHPISGLTTAIIIGLIILCLTAFLIEYFYTRPIARLIRKDIKFCIL